MNAAKKARVSVIIQVRLLFSLRSHAFFEIVLDGVHLRASWNQQAGIEKLFIYEFVPAVAAEQKGGM